MRVSGGGWGGMRAGGWAVWAWARCGDSCGARPGQQAGEEQAGVRTWNPCGAALQPPSAPALPAPPPPSPLLQRSLLLGLQRGRGRDVVDADGKAGVADEARAASREGGRTGGRAGGQWDSRRQSLHHDCSITQVACRAGALSRASCALCAVRPRPARLARASPPRPILTSAWPGGSCTLRRRAACSRC